MQDQRQESPKSPREKQQPQSCPCQQTLASCPIPGTPRHMPKTRGQVQSSRCCFHCTILASSPPLQPSHPLEHPQAGMAHAAVLSKAPGSRGGITPGMTLWLPASTCKRHSNLVQIFLMALSSSLLSNLFCFPLHPHLRSQSTLTSNGRTSTVVLKSLSSGCSMFPLRKKNL